ncbi:MAG: hypothetical protein N3A38_06260 [Planctomycetota bacterium]|nr:hypothetical protein [Planctomycetota bacterium]
MRGFCAFLFPAVIASALAAFSCGRRPESKPRDERDLLPARMRAMQREVDRIEDRLKDGRGAQVIGRAAEEIGREIREISRMPLDEQAYSAWLAASGSKDSPDSRLAAERQFESYCRGMKRACESLSEAANAMLPDWNAARYAVGSLRRSCAQCHASFAPRRPE